MSINLTKPTIGGDKDVWGTYLNANIDKQNIQDTTLESKLGFDYEGTEATTGSFGLFNNKIQVDLDTNTITFGSNIDTPILTTPVLNGIITGTANPLDLGNSAEVVNFEVANATTLKDLHITGTVTGIDVETTYLLTSDLSWSVGTGLDFENLQLALQEASKYKTIVKEGLVSTTTEKKSYTINITVEDGHIIDYWIFLEDTDLSFVNIIYAGAGVLNISTLSATVSTLGFIYGKNSKFPNFTCNFLISATANTNIPLFYLDNSSLFLKDIEIDNSLNNTSGKIKALNNSVVNLDLVTGKPDIYCDKCNIFLKASTLGNVRIYDSYCSSDSPAALAMSYLVVVNSDLKLSTITVNGRILIYKKSNVFLEFLTQNYITDGTRSDYCIRIEDGSSLHLHSLSQSITFSSQEDENIIVDNSELRIKSATLTTGGNSYAITSLNGSVTSLVSVTGTKNIAVNTLTANGIIFSN